MSRLTAKLRKALRAAACAGSAGERPTVVGEMDLSPGEWDALPDAIAWLDAAEGKVIALLTTAQIRALIKWANYGIKSTEGDDFRQDRTQDTAIKAMQSLVEAAGGTHEMYAGMVRHSLHR